ncbi:glycosyltransferase family 4 protein [Chloroflexota bacterium]
MKLLVCTPEYYPYGAGIANRVYNIVTQLRKLRVDCTVCSPSGPDIKLGSSYLIRKFGRLGLIYYWNKVANYFKETAGEYDIAWLNYPLFLRADPFKRKLITIDSTAYGKITHKMYPLPLHAYYKISFQIEKYCLRKVNNHRTRFTMLTSQGVDELKGVGIATKDIVCISNGVDTERFKPSNRKRELRRRFNLPEDGRILLSLGRLTEVKQPYKLIALFSSVEKILNDVTLAVAGSGKLAEKTRKLANDKGLKKIRFLGNMDYQNEVPDLYACSDYYIMTSKYEGLPLTLLEAMSSGLPCIVSDIPSLRLVEEVKCGIMVDLNNDRKATQQIIEYLGRNTLEHSKNAREYAIKTLTWEKVTKQYLKEFEELLRKE